MFQNLSEAIPLENDEAKILKKILIQKASWSTLFVPHGPPPRSGHVSVATPQSGGSIYIHGGEYSSKSGESFYHYKDFWCLTIDGKNSKWEEIKVSQESASFPIILHFVDIAII